MGLIPGQGTKIPHTMQRKKKEKRTLDNIRSDQQNDQFSKIPQSDITFFSLCYDIKNYNLLVNIPINPPLLPRQKFQTYFQTLIYLPLTFKTMGPHFFQASGLRAK